MGKGISTLISAVLIMAVTVSAVGIFSGWAPDLVNSVTESTENDTEKFLNCNKAAVEVVTAKYYSDDSNTTIVIHNTGREELEDLQASAWLNDLPMNNTVVSLKKGNFTAVNVTTTSEPDYVEANSKLCSSVSDRLEEID